MVPAEFMEGESNVVISGEGREERVITALSIHERTEINRARPLIGAHPRAGLDRVVGVNWEWIYPCACKYACTCFPDGAEESERRLSTFYSAGNC